MKRILVLASGGLDSTVLLYKAVKDVGRKNVIAMNTFYGQKHSKEMEYAKWTCEHLGIELHNVDLSAIFQFNPNCSALLKNSKMEIAHKSYSEKLYELNKAGKAPTVSAYVPYRNGLFLSYAGSVAIQLDCNIVYYGAHADDSAGRAYPDCTPEFIEAQSKAIEEGTAGKVKMEAPLWNLNKAGVVKLGIDLGMTHEEFEHTWSCYEGKQKPCGTCGTCIDRKEAFVKNGILDIN